MVERNDAVAEKIKNLLEKQYLAVLATQGDGQPYTSLMAYAYTEDLRFLVFATSISTRKHRNIENESRVALLIDDRSNTMTDFENAAALTITGEAFEVDRDEKEYYCGLYLKRHPSLAIFLATPTTQFFKIRVNKYQLVTRFEDVIEHRIKEDVTTTG